VFDFDTAAGRRFPPDLYGRWKVIVMFITIVWVRDSMSPHSAAVESEREIMAAVDEGRLVIADVSRDDAWLSITEGAAVTVAEFR
jgi:hypothetical protein